MAVIDKRASKNYERKKREESLEKKIIDARENIQRFEKKQQIKKGQIDKIEKEKSNTILAEEQEDTAANFISPSTKVGIQDNILHSFASYNTLFTLSGLNESELKDSSFLTNAVHDVIARSGGIGNPNLNRVKVNNLANAGPQIEIKDLENKAYEDSIRILENGRDIFFEEVNLLSTVAPSEERGMADFVKMEFQLHEPHGISLIEKIRASARLNGYRDYQDAPMLLTIEFKGYDEKGNTQQPNGSMIRKIPILITKVDMDVNQGGAIYTVTAVRQNDIAFDDRFKFPRTAINVQADNLKEALQEIEDKLNNQIVTERDEHKVRTVLDKYVILIDD